MIERVLVVGGAKGIGLSIATELAQRQSCEKIYIVDKDPIEEAHLNPKFDCHEFNLLEQDYSFFDKFDDVNALFITAGFGQLSLFKDVSEKYICDSFAVNSVAPIRIIHRYMNKLQSQKPFYCGVMVSIAGFMSSPFFAVYAATKASLKIFIESVNVELEKNGSENRILNVSPGSIDGTSFNNTKTDLSLTAPLAHEIIAHIEQRDDLFIPRYEDVFKNVLERYHADFRAEGRHSYEYKLNSGRVK